MKIERPIYMQQLIDSKDNGLIKIDLPDKLPYRRITVS